MEETKIILNFFLKNEVCMKWNLNIEDKKGGNSKLSVRSKQIFGRCWIDEKWSEQSVASPSVLWQKAKWKMYCLFYDAVAAACVVVAMTVIVTALLLWLSLAPIQLACRCSNMFEYLNRFWCVPGTQQKKWMFFLFEDGKIIMGHQPLFLNH